MSSTARSNSERAERRPARDAVGAPSGSITWTDWPAKRRPGRTAFAAAVVLATTAWVVTMDPVLGFVGTMLLLAALREGLFPTRFQLSDAGVKVDNPLLSRERPWDRFAGWSRVADGYLLDGVGRTALLRRRYDVVLRCPERLADVAAELEARLGEQAEAR